MSSDHRSVRWRLQMSPTQILNYRSVSRAHSMACSMFCSALLCTTRWPQVSAGQKRRDAADRRVRLRALYTLHCIPQRAAIARDAAIKCATRRDAALFVLFCFGFDFDFETRCARERDAYREASQRSPRRTQKRSDRCGLSAPSPLQETRRLRAAAAEDGDMPRTVYCTVRTSPSRYRPSERTRCADSYSNTYH